MVARLTGGLAGLAKQRKVTTIRGYGRFIWPHELRVELPTGRDRDGPSSSRRSSRPGSSAVTLPFIPDDPRVIDSTGALALGELPRRLLVIGGGIIGLEMATVYHELGAKVTIVELIDQLIPGADKDLVTPLAKRVAAAVRERVLKHAGDRGRARPEGCVVSFEGAKAPASDTSTGSWWRSGAAPTARSLAPNGLASPWTRMASSGSASSCGPTCAHIFAIGDVVGPPMLAHKAMHEAKVAAEVIRGQEQLLRRPGDSRRSPTPIPRWPGPESPRTRRSPPAWLRQGGLPVGGQRSLADAGPREGMTKMLFDEASGRVIGCGIVGPSAGDLIAEAGLAIEMGADAADIGLTIHPHPTLSETVAMAAEAFEGTITDLYLPRRK